MTQTASALRLSSLRRNLTAWTFQSWLAMFFIGAAYAKLTEPAALLEALLQWTALTDMTMVQAVGVAELGLGVGVLAPLVSWAWGRSVMQASLVLMAIEAVIMTVTHLVLGDPGLAAVNVALFALAVTTLRIRGRPSTGAAAHRPASAGFGSPAPVTG